jgi:hypothetical protein
MCLIAQVLLKSLDICANLIGLYASLCCSVPRLTCHAGRFIKCYDMEPLRLSRMHLFHAHSSGDKLQCPYKGCEKHFDRPTMITDDSVIPRQTHYACPFCMSRLELETAKEKIVGVRATEYPTVFDSPAKCAHFSGLLNTPKGSMSDECLICPKVLQCNNRKK